jgi:transitional endoplasmic reticulum ATPase
VDVEVLARSTNGFSGADIAEICTTASKLAIREAILATEERNRKIDEGEMDESEGTSDVSENMLIGKSHFNFAMSRARRSVSEKDLTLFEEFAEKQRAGRGEAANNFKFGEQGDAADEPEEDAAQDDLYS